MYHLMGVTNMSLLCVYTDTDWGVVGYTRISG